MVLIVDDLVYVNERESLDRAHRRKDVANVSEDVDS